MTKRKPAQKRVALDVSSHQKSRGRKDVPPPVSFTHKALLEIIDDFKNCKLLPEAQFIAEGQGLNEPDAKHLSQAYEQLLSIPSPRMWAILNRYRVHLIKKDLTEGLSPADMADLEILQTEADRYLKTFTPRPLKELRSLKQEFTIRKKSS
jgi:hypothetical protein